MADPRMRSNGSVMADPRMCNGQTSHGQWTSNGQTSQETPRSQQCLARLEKPLPEKRCQQRIVSPSLDKPHRSAVSNARKLQSRAAAMGSRNQTPHR